MIKVSDYIIKILSRKTKYFFGGQGGSVVHLIDSIYKNKKLKFIPGQSEQGSSLAADAYFRSSGKLGVVIGTSGPGIVNFVQGLACSYFDSIPSLYIAGAPVVYDLRKNLKIRQIGFQEMEVQSLLRPLTKGIWIIKKKNEVTKIFNEAISKAFSGRMGPVVIEIPDDIQRAFISPKTKKKNLTIQKKKFFFKKKDISDTINLIKNSKRPIIIAGHGVTLSKSAKLVKEFANKTNIPYLYTWASADQFNFNEKLNAGSFGVAATRAGNFSLQNSDLIIGLGVRLSPSLVGANPNFFAPSAKKIIVEIDKNEFLNHRIPKIDLKINSDVNVFLKKIIKKKIIKKNNSWIKKVNFFKKNYQTTSSNKIFEKNYVDPYFFFENLSHIIKEESILIPDTSANLIWAMQAFKILKKIRIFTAFNHSPMGYSMAASVGAYLGVKGKSNIIATIGDGSVPMNVQELETIKNYNVNVKIFVFSNRGYSLIKQTQETWLDGRYSGVNKESGLSLPNNLKIANSYGIKSIYIKNNNELKKKLFRIINTKGPILVVLNIDPSCRVEPKLDYGRALHDMSPKLPEEEIRQNMMN